MAAVFDSAIDRAFFATPEVEAKDTAVALSAAAASLDDFARSACSLVTCPSRSAIRASMGLRSVQPAVITSKATMQAFAIVIFLFLRVKSRPNHSEMSRTPPLLHSGLSAYCAGIAGIAQVVSNPTSAKRRLKLF